MMYEGAPDFPDFGRWFKIIQDNKVSVFYTAPTAIRMFMKAGEKWTKEYDISSIRLWICGEPINPEAWMWYRKHFGADKCQIMDTWWQTETGTFLVSPLPITPLKPGSPTFPLPGFTSISSMKMPTQLCPAQEATSSAILPGLPCSEPSMEIP